MYILNLYIYIYTCIYINARDQCKGIEDDGGKISKPLRDHKYQLEGIHIYISIYRYVCICIYIHICIYVFAYIYIYMYIYMHIEDDGGNF
jgi:hypothetical protein